MKAVPSRLGSRTTGFITPITVNQVLPRNTWMWPVTLRICSVLAAWAPSTTVG